MAKNTSIRSTISEEDEEILLKRIEMTEEAHKLERNKSNQMEDVWTNYSIRIEQCSYAILFCNRRYEKWKQNFKFCVNTSPTWYVIPPSL